MVQRCAALLALTSALMHADPGLARNTHFEVYAQSGPVDARAILLEFERLRAYFVQQTGLRVDHRPAVRVIAFRSPEEYANYELQSTADAYYVGTESRDLIVLPAGSGHDLQMAAHEYAHLALHSNRLQLPPWLNEGLSDCFSAVRANQRESRAGNRIPPAQVLRTRPWIPLSELVMVPADSPLRADRGSAAMFYAESWALADMLTASPEYGPRFPDLIGTMKTGAPSDQSLVKVYGRSLDTISQDLHTWTKNRHITPVSLPTVVLSEAEIQVSEIPPFAWRSVLADLLLAIGKLDRAQSTFEQLQREAPENPEFPAALASVALQKQDWSGARRYWRDALELGFQDAAACYRYAVMADAAGFPAADFKPALERAAAVRPNFDDAHFMLATLENNAGHYEAAIAQFRAMQTIAPSRQFAYWLGLAESYNQLGRRDEAEAAARQAGAHAATAEQRVHALKLLQIAQTDLDVQFTTDANGQSRLVATRIPHGETDWNPFIEPGDRIRRLSGKLQFIECSNNGTRIVVQTSIGSVTVTVADPARVHMRNAPPEFTCGPQPGIPVTIVYAARSLPDNSEGLVRGIELN